MNSMTSGYLYSGYNSDHGLSYTYEVNFGPAYTVGQASFHGVDGDGLHHTGVAAYRFRPDPNGPEQTVNLGAWKSWAPYIYVNQASSVTFGIAVGAKQEAYVLFNLFFW